jgi:hypothetical protein
MLSRALFIKCLFALLLVGCASRTVPTTFPASAAAAPDAAAAAPADVTAALASEPPLPGQPVTAWPALRDDTEKPAAHGGHHAHH